METPLSLSLSLSLSLALFSCCNCSSISLSLSQSEGPEQSQSCKLLHFLKRMALQTADPPTAPTAQVVGNAFVGQYYHILHRSPELVFRFYQDSSVMSRPDSSGVMTSVTTMEGINEKILSLDYKNCKAEIKTADAQKSYNDGVTVLVTGCITDKDNLSRKFAQSFFLAPQDNGYFVLNDVFRYMDDGELLENQPINGTDDATNLDTIPGPDLEATVQEGHQNAGERAYDPSDHELLLVNENEAVVENDPHANGKDNPAVVEIASSSAQEDTPKKSYASIVKVAKGSPGPTKVYVPANTAKVTPKKADNQPVKSAAPAPVLEASVLSGADTHEDSDSHEEVEGHSIYIRNLPFDITESQLEVEFQKFGPIKQGGIQVRNNKQQGYCFGFVEFLSLSSMNDAIQASPIDVKGCRAVVEAKRTTTRVSSGSGGRGRFSSGRGGFRNDSFRVRGNYGVGGRSFGRNEYGNRGEFSGRGRGSGRVGEGRGRGYRPSGPKQNAGSK